MSLTIFCQCFRGLFVRFFHGVFLFHFLQRTVHNYFAQLSKLTFQCKWEIFTWLCLWCNACSFPVIFLACDCDGCWYNIPFPLHVYSRMYNCMNNSLSCTCTWAHLWENLFNFSSTISIYLMSQFLNLQKPFKKKNSKLYS